MGGGTLAAAAAQTASQPLLWAGAAAIALSATGSTLPASVPPRRPRRAAPLHLPWGGSLGEELPANVRAHWQQAIPLAYAWAGAAAGGSAAASTGRARRGAWHARARTSPPARQSALRGARWTGTSSAVVKTLGATGARWIA